MATAFWLLTAGGHIAASAFRVGPGDYRDVG